MSVLATCLWYIAGDIVIIEVGVAIYQQVIS